MTFVSKFALAAALTLGSTALGAAPAMAQKKGDKQQAAGPQVSEEFRKPAAAADTALKAYKAATDANVKAQQLAELDTQTKAAEAVAKNDDEKYFAAFYRLQVELARNNQAGQMQALGALAANPKTPPENAKTFGALYEYMVGDQLSQQKKFPEAIAALTKARELGATQGDLPILLANAYSATGKPAEAVAEVDKAMQAMKAAGKPIPEDWYKFAVPRVQQLGDRNAMATWLARYVHDYPTVKNWRWAIQVFRQGTPAGGNEKTERLDLYRLLLATNALADRTDYVDYAVIAQQSGLPWEVVTAIESGRKSGKLPTSDADANKLLAAGQASVKSEGSLDTLYKQAMAASTGKPAAATADAYLASANYAKAVELYDQALTKGGVNADEVNLHKGVALKGLNRNDEAKAAFGAVSKTSPYGNLAFLWQSAIDLPPLTA